MRLQCRLFPSGTVVCRKIRFRLHSHPLQHPIKPIRGVPGKYGRDVHRKAVAFRRRFVLQVKREPVKPRGKFRGRENTPDKKFKFAPRFPHPDQRASEFNKPGTDRLKGHPRANAVAIRHKAPQGVRYGFRRYDDFRRLKKRHRVLPSFVIRMHVDEKRLSEHFVGITEDRMQHGRNRRRKRREDCTASTYKNGRRPFSRKRSPSAASSVRAFKAQTACAVTSRRSGNGA